MISNKQDIKISLMGKVIKNGQASITVNCGMWDTMLNLDYGSTKLHIESAASEAGYDAVEGSAFVQLYRRAIR